MFLATLSTIASRDAKLDESNTPTNWKAIGQALLLHFEISERDIKDLHEALSRSYDQFPHQWNEGWNIRLPQLMISKYFTRSVALRAQSYALAERQQSAYEDLLLAFKLAQLGPTDFGISRLVESSNLTEIMDATRLAQQKHLWGKQEWDSIAILFDQNRFQRAVSKDFRLGRIAARQTMDKIFASNLYESLRPRMIFRSLRLPIDWNDPVAKSTIETLAPLLRPLFHTTLMAEWRRRFELYGVYIDKAEQVEKASQSVPWSNLPRVYETESKPKDGIFHDRFSSIDKFLDRMFLAETTTRLASLSCSLERFYVKHQHYPDSLEALIPSFLAETPIDPMSGRLWNYHPKDKLKGYKLYSVGKNGIDEGGIFRSEKPTGPKVSTDDIVWEIYEGLPNLSTLAFVYRNEEIETAR